MTIKGSDEDWRAEHARISGPQAESARIAAGLTQEQLQMKAFLGTLSPEEQRRRVQEGAEEKRRQVSWEAEQRRREEARRPSRFQQAMEAVGTTIAGAFVIAVVLVLALGGLYVLVRIVKWFWTD